MKKMSRQIPFSIVTTCRNEMESLPRWKKDILAQSRPPGEIVVVDAFSDDGTFEFLTQWAQRDARVKIIQEKGMPAHGRNFAIQNAAHEHVLSTDLGVGLSKDWCQELIAPFENDPNLEVVAGNTCIDRETIHSPWARAEYWMENGGEPKHRSGHVPSNRSSAYKKSVWKRLRGLPEDLTFAADDAVYGRQILQEGLKIAFAPNAMTYWGRPNKAKLFFREQYVYGRGDGEAFIKTPLVFKWHLRGSVPALFVPLLHVGVQCLKLPFYKGLGKAVVNGDLPAFFTMPLLMGGRAFHYAKGYLQGHGHGQRYCLDCRSRLRRNFNGYSIK